MHFTDSELPSMELISDMRSLIYQWPTTVLATQRSLTQVVYTLQVQFDSKKGIRGCNCSHINETVGSYLYLFLYHCQHWATPVVHGHLSCADTTHVIDVAYIYFERSIMSDGHLPNADSQILVVCTCYKGQHNKYRFFGQLAFYAENAGTASNLRVRSNCHDAAW